jgi:hypothetical protein
MIRAVLAYLAPDHSVTFVLDAARRVYAHSFTRRDVGLDIRPGAEMCLTLRTNHRNTQRIAARAPDQQRERNVV